MQGISEHFVNIKEAPVMFTKLCKELKQIVVFDSIGETYCIILRTICPTVLKYLYMTKLIRPASIKKFSIAKTFIWNGLVFITLEIVFDNKTLKDA